jgi:hypothetical protein
MIDLKTLWNAMPPNVQRKMSCHDLKQIVDNYNHPEAEREPSPKKERYVVTTDLPEFTVHDLVEKRDLFPTKSGNRDYSCSRCYEKDATLIAMALNLLDSENYQIQTPAEK